MNKAPWIFLGVLFTLSLSWWGMVYGPASQLAGQSADKGDGTAVLPRVGLAKQGEQVYRENGCYYCHTRTAIGGDFGYELQLEQLGDNRELTDKVFGDKLKGRIKDSEKVITELGKKEKKEPLTKDETKRLANAHDALKKASEDIWLVDLAFKFKKVANAKKAIEDAIAAEAANKKSIEDSEKVITELGKKEPLTKDETKRLADAHDALKKAIEVVDKQKQSVDVAKNQTLPAAVTAFRLFSSGNIQGVDQKKKDILLFTAYGLSGVELKDKSVMIQLGMGEQIIDEHKKIANEAMIKLTDGKAKWGDIEDMVRGLKTRAGAQFKLQPVVINWPDVQNGVALRQSVSRDFMHDAHAMPGVMRLGPDLANAGGKPALADANQFYVHLYQPRLISEKSAMPPYRYLFRKIKLNAGESVPDNALEHADFEEGYAIIPTEKAEALFEFLKSLRTDALPEAPIVDKPQPENNQ